ncbi:MAG: hypothetical protein RJB32_349 [Actinomycetota bacterium]
MADKKMEPTEGSEENTPAAEAPSTSTTVAPKAKFDWSSLNTLAVVSLASAISGFAALVAVITGHISLAQIKRTGESGKVMAVTGLVLGYVNIALWIIFGVFGVIAQALLFSGFMGLQPMGPEYMEFHRGFDGMHMWQDR